MRANLVNGKSSQCNSCRIKESKEGRFARTHGLSNTRNYKIWYRIMEYCYNPSNPSYQYFGGKGITVCKRWHDIVKFNKDIGDIPDGMTIGRKSFTIGFTPSNWCLVPLRERNFPWVGKHVFHYRKKSYSYSQLARLIGFSRQRISQLLEIFTPDEIIIKYKTCIDESLKNQKNPSRSIK
ncbi:MAG: hypothetical protein HYZ34_12365 [Ignavibacteriae bacterium]|nr:hypothetical protein [Ignavibacteriota bacterium]